MRKPAFNMPPERTVTTPPPAQIYVPKWTVHRPGAQDHEAIPSLHTGTRYYRDGRQVPVEEGEP